MACLPTARLVILFDGSRVWIVFGDLQAPSFADVNEDGFLEVILGAADGGVYVLSGLTGLDMPGFPFYTQVPFPPCFPPELYEAYDWSSSPLSIRT